MLLLLYPPHAWPLSLIDWRPTITRMEKSPSHQGCNMTRNHLHQGDCVAGMSAIQEGCVDLVFADPPFNIGYKYDVYEDKKAADDHLDWTRNWGRELVRVLKPTGTFW